MNLELLLQQFDVMAEMPNGVETLRDSILQLAVRGKLVPQDTGDEPASALLHRIAKEKQRLYEEGTIGKPTTSSPISDNEMPFDIPDGWTWSRLEAVGVINPRNHLPDELNVAFCPMAVLPETYQGPIAYEQRPWREIKKGYTHFAERDVVVAKITPCFQNGKAAVMRGLPGGAGAGTTELHVFRPIGDTIVPEFVLVFVRSPGFVGGGVQMMTGTAGQQRVPAEYFAKSPFPLPPLSEQQRIVAKVDELMALCDQLEVRQQQRAGARVRLSNSVLHHLAASSCKVELADHWRRLCDNFDILYDAPETVAELQEAVLQLAVRGRLVPQDADEEPASLLLQRIAAEKQRLFSDGKIGKPKPLRPVTEGGLPFGLPAGWEWVRTGTISLLAEYGTSQRASSCGEVPILRMNNIQAGAVTVENIKYVSQKIDDLPRLFLDTGDLLFNRTNSYELVGKTGLFMGASGRFTFASYLIRVRTSEHVLPQYVNLAMNSRYFRVTQVEPEITQQTGQANFNGTKLLNTLIPLPPANEQKRIVAKVDELRALCDRLQVRLTQAREMSEHMAASVVHNLTAA